MTVYSNNRPVAYNSELQLYESLDGIGSKSYSSSEVIKSFNNLEPRLSLSYQLNEQSSVKASYQKMTQYIHLLSNTTAATPLDIWTPSGRYIKPQIGHQVATGYFRTFKENTFEASIEAYYKWVNNRIDYIDGAQLIAQDNIETQILNGRSRSYGIELLIKKTKGDFTGWLGYTWSKAKQQTVDSFIGGPGINNGEWYNANFDRPHDLSITANYKLNKKWSIGGNFIFQTGRPVTFPNAQYQYLDMSVANYGLRNENRLPAYHRIDLSATYVPNRDNKRWKGEWVFGIYNVYNRKNAASITFGQNENTLQNEAVKTSIFGIVPAITYNFKF